MALLFLSHREQKLALEEFLGFISKKQKVSVSLEEEQKEFTDLQEAEGDRIVLKKDP